MIQKQSTVTSHSNFLSSAARKSRDATVTSLPETLMRNSNTTPKNNTTQLKGADLIIEDHDEDMEEPSKSNMLRTDG